MNIDGVPEGFELIEELTEDENISQKNTVVPEGFEEIDLDFKEEVISADDIIEVEEKELVKTPDDIIERNKRWDRGIFLMEEREEYEEYSSKENKEKRKKLEADEIFNNLETTLKETPEEKITEATAKNYFKLDQRPVSIVTDENVEPDFYENMSYAQYKKEGLLQGFLTKEEAEAFSGGGTKRVGKVYQPIEEYLGPEKFKQYENYEQTGELTPINAQNQAQIEAVKNQSLNEIYKKETQLFLRNVPEDIRELMAPFGDDKPYQSLEDAQKGLDRATEFIKESGKILKNDFDKYQEQAKPYQDAINEVIKKVNDIEKTIPSGNINDGSSSQIKEYQTLIAEAEKIQNDFNVKGLDNVYDNLLKQQKLYDQQIQSLIDKSRDVETKGIIEKQLGLDYSLSARTAMALEEFFVGGAFNLGSLTNQLLLKGGRFLVDDSNTKIINSIDNYLEFLTKTTRDYNSKLAKKRATTIPDNITLDDIGNENVNFFDWFGESLANNSPSIVTTFIPGGAALKGGMLIKGATEAGKKIARQKARELATYGTRTAQAIFFVGESGGRYGDIELQQANALESLPKLKKQIDLESDLDKKKQLQQEYDDLERISNYSFAQKAFSSFAYGSTAALAETFGSLKIIQDAGSLARNMGKQEFKIKAYASPLNFAANVSKNAISGISRNAGRAITIEEAEETLTQIAHNIIDISVLGENKSMIEGLDKEFFANTAVTSLAIMAPKTMGNTRNMIKNEFTIREEIEQNEEKVLELIQLQEQFSALEAGPERDQLRKRRRELLTELGFADGMTLNKLNAMTTEEIVEAADLSRQMRQVQGQATKLGATGDLSEAGKKAKQQLEEQYNNLNRKREDLLSKRAKEDRNKIKETREKLGESFINLNAEYYYGLYDFYKNVAMTLMPKNGKFIKVDTDNVNWRDDLTDLSKEELAQVETVIESGNNAAAVGNNIIINERVIDAEIAMSGDVGLAGYAAAAPLEELFHIQNKAKNIVDKDGMLSEEATKAVDEAIEVLRNKFELGKIKEKDYNDLIARFNLYKTGGRGKVILKSGRRGQATADAEEIMAQMNNAVALGLIDLNDIETMPSLKNFINGISKDIFGDSSWMFDLKDANDVFNFIKNYQSNIQEGVRLAEPEEEDDIIKMSEVDQQQENQTIKGIFDKFTGPAESRKFKSKEEFKKSPEYFEALLEIEQSNTLDASIRNTVSQAYLNMNPDFVQEVKQRISDKYQAEYDASKNSLFGWLTGKNRAGQTIIQLSAGDIQAKKGKQPTTVSTDKKIGGEDSKTTVAETLVSDEISPEDYADMKLAQDKLKKIKPQQSKIADKIDLTDNEINLAKRDIINFLRKTDRPSMTDPKKFFKAFVDYTTGSGVQPGGFAKVIYDKLSLPKDGSLSTKNRKAFIESIAEDLIALNKVDPAVMRRSKWTPFYELEIKNMNPTQMQKAIDDGRIPSTSNLKSGLDLFKTLNPSVDQVVDYLMGIRPDVLKRKMPKFLGEVIVKNEFNEIVDNTTQPVYDTKGNETDNTVDLSKSLTQEEVTRGAPQVREKIARPMGLKFSAASKAAAARHKLKHYDLSKKSTKKDVDRYVADIKTIVEEFDKMGMSGMFNANMAKIRKKLPKDEITIDGVVYKQGLDEYLRKEISKIPGITNTKASKQNNYGKSTPNQTFGGDLDVIRKKATKQKIKEFNDRNSKMFDDYWKGLNKILSKNKELAISVYHLLQNSSAERGNPHSLGALIEAIDNVAKGRAEWEHAVQNVVAYNFLFDAILYKDVDFNKAFKAVKKNYILVAMNKVDELKVAKAGYKIKMPEGWDMYKNFWWERYLNPQVAAIEGGIANENFKWTGEGENIFKTHDSAGNKITTELSDDIVKSKDSNIKELSNDVIKFNKSMSANEVIGYAKTVDKALANARKLDAPVKKIRVFDFDDTLAQTKSIVFYTKADGTEGQLTAEEFAEKGADLVDQGAVMDFSDFNIVRDGKRGPLFNVAKKIKDARGNEDLFVLTARAPESQNAIYEFLKSEGLEFKRENIIGLGNSTGAAKASWIVGKAAEGYNDFYFADDAFGNVEAVRDVLDQIDVKSKVQQAKVKFSKSISAEINKIIEQKTGIASEKRYSRAKAKVRGASKGNKKFFIPYSAEDFMGLLYPLLSKGKLGDSQMAWFKEHLLDPYGRAIENLSRDRIQMMQDFKVLKKSLDVPKDLRKTNESGFTNEQAVRVYLFNKMGHDIPGLSKTDLSELVDIVNSDGKLKAFADQILSVTKGDGYVKPDQEWLAGTITTDLIDLLNTTKRQKYLQQSGFLDNISEIFNQENLNKLEAAYGAKYREALENILARMKSGKNRLFSGSRLSNRALDYINGSIGTIMFFNTRSAVLQTISSINFLNWSFNNPIKAGKAFANQKQYWKDFKMLMNSDYLTDRRNGLKLNINENEIANAAATSRNKARGVINYILQKGYLPTQFADSFAIASGGATFYRNRVNDLVSQGVSLAEAEKQALSEWRETAEISQQSSDPSKISQQQSSNLGRVILAFANTPMQYARLQKRAIQDLVNRRGDAKANVSKIIYYGVVQNIIFNALQQALFGLAFGDDEEDEKKNKKYHNVANGMLDSLLRGLGIAGATTAVIKNFLLEIYERSGRKRPEYVDAVYKLLSISPPIGSKISKIRQAAYQFDSKKRREEIFEKGFSIDNPAYEASAKVISAVTNVPIDRLFNKANNIEAALAEDVETWQRVAMLAGWPEWQIVPKDKKQEELPRYPGRKIKRFSSKIKRPSRKIKKI